MDKWLIGASNSLWKRFQVDNIGYVMYKWTYDDKEIQGWQPVVTLSFKKAKR